MIVRWTSVANGVLVYIWSIALGFEVSWRLVTFIIGIWIIDALVEIADAVRQHRTEGK